MKLTINEPLTTLNEYTKANRGNKFGGANVKKKQDKIILYYALKQRFKLEPIKYDVNFVWYVKDHRKDHDNICFAKKFVFDGLIKAGILANDNPRYIGNFSDTFKIDKNERVEVEFIPAVGEVD